MKQFSLFNYFLLITCINSISSQLVQQKLDDEECTDVIRNKPSLIRGVSHIGIPSACFLKADPGPCSKDLIRIYFDFKTYSCKAFSYSGCGGNPNRFISVKNCYKLCHPYYRQRLITIDQGGDSNSSENPNIPTTTVITPVEITPENASNIKDSHIIPPNAPEFEKDEEPADMQVVHEFDVYQKPGVLPPGAMGLQLGGMRPRNNPFDRKPIYGQQTYQPPREPQNYGRQNYGFRNLDSQQTGFDRRKMTL